MKSREDNYNEKVKSRFEDIKRWLELGCTEREIAKNLGVSWSTFHLYKKGYSDLSNLLKSGRKNPVEEIKAALMKRAKGFEYKEKKVITQYTVFDDPKYGELPAKVIRTEVTTKTVPPDTTAALLLLQHWDKDDDGNIQWSRDPAQIEIRKKELELKEKEQENSQW